ncbi:hypothetical protein VNI00_007533 [Paramarasmius palmivorus]|uniref:Cupin 2 conserved barrel domain-containing protein n=1 Tax=Paramarasmius palmivorus TaxID=297713 RepID=A0AAW0D3P5_9AGAR
MSFVFPKILIQKPTRDPDGAWNFFDGALKTWTIHSDTNTSTTRQVFKHSNPHTGNGRASTATPPYHWHIYQTERFDVKSGVLCYDLDGKLGKLQAGETLTIPPSRNHTFWADPDTKTDLDVHITLCDGPNKALDDVFLLNFYGYLSSVTMRGEAPNILQMLAFLDHAEVVLADFPLGTGRLANIVLGRWIGRGLAGYQVEYKEFSEDSE